MGQRKYPPLTTNQIISILLARGYILDHTKGDHCYYILVKNGKKHIVQVDMGCAEYGKDLIPMVLKETGLSRDEFYSSTKNTAKKINIEYVEVKE
jgi:predicted RNA binding protein YcfA (HicA-like mRNA interferase family)